jgi:phosphopantetheinyl transferase
MHRVTRHHFKQSIQPPPPWKVCTPKASDISLVKDSFTLVRIQLFEEAQFRKRTVREVLAQELLHAAGRPVRWEDSPRGPRVLDLVANALPSVSISYADSEAWLGIGWRGAIGVDAVALREITDWEAVASTYLDGPSIKRLRESTNPALEFTREWAQFEARLKLGGLSLEEDSLAPSALVYGASFETVAVAVAV